MPSRITNNKSNRNKGETILKKTTKIIALAAFLSVTAVGARQAHAIPTLSLDDGSTFMTIVDNGVGDLDSRDGFIHSSTSFANFMAAITIGLSKPILGTADLPHLHLNSVNVSSVGAAADMLTIKFTDTDFSDLASSVTGFESEIGGLTAGNVTYATYFDNSNAAFGTATLLSNLGSFSGGAFSGSAFASLGSLTPTPDGPYSLTLVATVAHPAGSFNVTSFDASVAVPEPSTLLLLGSGMLGFAFLRRRKG